MSEFILSAAAWTPINFASRDAGGGETSYYRVMAEASVTDTTGRPIENLHSTAWSGHLTFDMSNAQGSTSAKPSLPQTAAATITMQASSQAPGCYTLLLE